MRKEIRTAGAPAPVGPYSQAVEVNGILYISGQIGIDPKTGQMPDHFKAQAEQVLANIYAILKEAGYSKDNVVKITVYMVDLSKFKEFNDLYEDFFKDVEPKPARAVVGVNSLPLSAFVEVETIAIKG